MQFQGHIFLYISFSNTEANVLLFVLGQLVIGAFAIILRPSYFNLVL